MKYSTYGSGLALWAYVAIAQGHTHLQKATPADGSVIAASPPSIALKFSEAARVTAAWIQKEGRAKEKLGALPEKPAGEVTIAVPPLTPGSYVVSWRAASDDGHVMPGQIHFTISANGRRKDPR
jgi:methionine-rich copper-binding protein CopC